MNKYVLYRPEIDGLRAIAVLSVIFYHAKLNLFSSSFFLSGGFIGVDIFFVISGYLITKIILNEIEKTNNFSFLDFYIRRIKRILPALFFVIIFTFPFIYSKTLPLYFENYLKSLISIIFFVSNIFFWNLGIGYDQLQDVMFQPFLHAWTLSLEEQFYIFFPIFFIFFYKFLKDKCIYLILIFFFISLLLSDIFSYSHASVNFYFLPTRIWEFFAGTIIVFFEKKKLINFFSSKISFIYTLIGIFLIFFSVIFLDDKMYLPSVISLIPIVGTSLIIFFTDNRESLFKKILSSRIFVGIGKISYSLYLWHYPILIVYPNKNIILKLILIFIFSIFSYFVIEKKFRQKINTYFYSIKTIIISFFIIFVFSITFLFTNNFNFEKFPKIIQSILIEKKAINVESDSKFNEKNLKKNKSIFIAGDSHMHVLWKELSKNEGKISEYNIINQNLSNGCIYVYNFERIDLISNKKLEPCTLIDQSKRRSNFLKEKNSVVILGGRLPLWLNTSSVNRFSRLYKKKDPMKSGWGFYNNDNISLEEGIKYSIYDLLKNNVKVILIYPVPVFEFDPTKKIFDSYMHDRKNFKKNLTQKPYTKPFDKFLVEAKKSHLLLDSIQHPNLYKIYTHKIFCEVENNQCKSHDSDEIFYRDNNHLSSFGNKRIVKKINEILNLIEEK